MPDSEELDEILKEIKNINAPKEKPEPKEEQPLTLADDKPAKEEAEAKPEPVKENVNFNDFSSFNSAQHSDIPKDNKGEKKMPKKKGKNKKPLIIAIVVILVAAIAVAAVFAVKIKTKSLKPQHRKPHRSKQFKLLLYQKSTLLQVTATLMKKQSAKGLLPA